MQKRVTCQWSTVLKVWPFHWNARFVATKKKSMLQQSKHSLLILPLKCSPKSLAISLECSNVLPPKQSMAAAIKRFPSSCPLLPTVLVTIQVNVATIMLPTILLVIEMTGPLHYGHKQQQSSWSSCSSYTIYGTWHGKLNFPEEFLVVPRGMTRIFRTGAAELPRGKRGFFVWVAQIFRTDGRESSMRIRVENGGNQKANFVRNNAKGSRNAPQGSFKISL